jgi:aryl-alcohol dehydrogenase-like predicted oxidoreductase
MKFQIYAICTFLAALSAEAFVGQCPSFSSPRSLKTFRPASQLFSSSSEDDELSKLIGKRNQIKRKTKDELPKVDDFLEEIAEEIDPDTMDMENMPEFKTKRPVRTPEKKSKKQEEQSRTPSKETEVVDYLAEYDDENEFHIPNRMGISTRCWGDETKGFISSGKLKKQDLRQGRFVPGDLQVAYNKLLEAGILLFETSPEYGKALASKKLSAEDILGRCIKEQEIALNPILVGTYPNKSWQRGAKGLTDSLSESCDRMGVSGVEAFQVKNTGWLPTGGLVKGMVEAVIDNASTNYVGVQNMQPIRLRRIQKKLDQEGIVLTTNLFEFSLTNRKNEKLIKACKTLGIVPFVQNPFDGGLASGQFTASNPSGGIAGTAAKFSFASLEKLQPLHSVLETVSERAKTRVKRELADMTDRFKGGRGPTVRMVLNFANGLCKFVSHFSLFLSAPDQHKYHSEASGIELCHCQGWSATPRS